MKTFAPCRIKILGNRPCETLLLVGKHFLDAGMIVEMMVVIAGKHLVPCIACSTQFLKQTKIGQKTRNSLPRANVRKYIFAPHASTEVKTTYEPKRDGAEASSYRSDIL